MSAEKDITLDEKRVYGDKTGTTEVFVAAETGLARVEVSDDIVGEFGLAYRGPTVGVAGDAGRLAAATPEDVLVGQGEAGEAGAEAEFAETGFGAATAVGFADGLVAAGERGVARYHAGDWTHLSDPRGVRAIGGEFLATEAGVVRLDGSHVGLDDARDVATAGADVLAATGDGLYYLANGWMEALGGAFGAAATDGDRAFAIDDEGVLYERRDGAWSLVETPQSDLVDVTLADGVVYAVTADGTVLVDAGDGWRSRALGLRGVRDVAIP